jgi:hypothetical protein
MDEVVSGYVFELFAEDSEYYSVQWFLCGAEEVHSNDRRSDGSILCRTQKSVLL